MSKSLLSDLAAALLVVCSSMAGASEVSSPAQWSRPQARGADWVGFAVSPRGHVFKTDSTYYGEVDAQSAAKSECENNRGYSCQVIAVPVAWNVSVVRCVNGSYVAGVHSGTAFDYAAYRAQQSGLSGPCTEIYSY